MRIPWGSYKWDKPDLLSPHFELNPDSTVRTIYDFSVASAIQPVSLRFDSTYDMVHKELERTHNLDHTLKTCPERLHPLTVRMWTPAGGWAEVKIKPVD